MSVQLVTSWQTLMWYAKQLGKARLSGDSERIAKAQQEHDHYRDMCLKADYMVHGDFTDITRAAR